jgi:rhodanese-related sulfurtransferase
MKMFEPGRPSSIVKPPPSISAVELRLLFHAGEAVTLVDVREPAVFAARHLPGSINAPDSQTTALVKKMQTIARAVIVCANGRTSAQVARTLGFCGFRSLAYLEGGVEAWDAAGGTMAETTRSGFERILPRDAEPAKPGLWERLLTAIKQPV